MSAAGSSRVAPVRPEVVTEGFPESRPGWVQKVTSGDHKAVGVMYLAAALSFLVLAVCELVLMRVQLIVPESTILTPENFDRLLSTFGVTAVVLFAIPVVLGLIGYVVPLQIGARGTAFPRLGALSFWLYLAGGVTVYATFLYRPPDAGVNPLPPLSDTVFSPTAGVDAWLAGVGLAVLGFVLFAINLLATLHRMRAPGMVWRRLPLFSWAGTISAWMLLVAGPVMIAACTMLFVDRQFGGVFFDAGEGGSPILWQHLSWFFFTASYLIVLIAAFGVISEVVATFSGKPPFSHRAIAGSVVAIGVLGPLAWMQNMYTAPIGIGWTYFAMAAAATLTIPVGLLLVNWLATLWGGSLRLRTPLLFALGAISTISFGLAGELAYSVVPVGWQLDSTTAAQAATYYALVGGAVFGGFAGLHYWFPKLTGRTMGEGLGRLSFWTILVGIHATAIPMGLAGLEGQVVDAYKYYEADSVSGYNLAASIGSFVLAAGIVITLANAAYSAGRGREAGADPWGGATLEWFALSPPPPHNFDVIPDVRGTEPLRDIRDAVRERTETWRPPPPLERPKKPAGDPASADA